MIQQFRRAHALALQNQFFLYRAIFEKFPLLFFVERIVIKLRNNTILGMGMRIKK